MRRREQPDHTESTALPAIQNRATNSTDSRYQDRSFANQRLQGHLEDPNPNADSKNSLGLCHRLLGEFRRAIELFEQALAINRKAGNRDGQPGNLVNLGTCYYELGQRTLAIDLFEQALAIDREIGDREGEATDLGNLGVCHQDLGQIPRAIELYEQALAIEREIAKLGGEVTHLGNLGTCHHDLGQISAAIELYEQALAITRQTGNRYAEALVLVGLAAAQMDLGAWSQAAECSRQAIDVADAISSAQAQSGARLGLAFIRLLTGELQAAQQVAIAARGHDYPPDRAEISLLLGIAQLRQEQLAEAAQEFGNAVTQADELLQQADGAYAALDTKALALCGLALTTNPEQAAEAAAVFRAARTITSVDGIVRQNLALFDALATADPNGILPAIRPDAEGRTVTAAPPP